MLINNRLKLLVCIFMCIAWAYELTYECYRLFTAGREVLDLVVGSEVDDALEVLLPEVIVNMAGYRIAFLYPEVEIYCECMQLLEFIISRKFGEGLRYVKCSVFLPSHPYSVQVLG